MNENLIRVQEEADLGKAGIVQLAENAFESAWLPRASKDRYIATSPQENQLCSFGALSLIENKIPALSMR
jgi:adenosine deaminase